MLLQVILSDISEHFWGVFSHQHLLFAVHVEARNIVVWISSHEVLDLYLEASLLVGFRPDLFVVAFVYQV